jgi:hypothetical protein
MSEQQIGRLRPARNVKVGWHIRALDDNDQPEWCEVSVVMHTSNIFTGQKLLRVAFKDGGSAACDLSDEVMTRTIPEVRRAAKARERGGTA